MRENRPYGSEGGEAKAFPTPILLLLPQRATAWSDARRATFAGVDSKIST